jgi:hypothetical protein
MAEDLRSVRRSPTSRRAGGALAPRERRHQDSLIGALLADQAFDFAGGWAAPRLALRRAGRLAVGWFAGLCPR